MGLTIPQKGFETIRIATTAYLQDPSLLEKFGVTAVHLNGLMEAVKGADADASNRALGKNPELAATAYVVLARRDQDWRSGDQKFGIGRIVGLLRELSPIAKSSRLWERRPGGGSGVLGSSQPFKGEILGIRTPILNSLSIDSQSGIPVRSRTTGELGRAVYLPASFKFQVGSGVQQPVNGGGFVVRSESGRTVAVSTEQFYANYSHANGAGITPLQARGAILGEGTSLPQRGSRTIEGFGCTVELLPVPMPDGSGILIIEARAPSSYGGFPINITVGDKTVAMKRNGGPALLAETYSFWRAEVSYDPTMTVPVVVTQANNGEERAPQRSASWITRGVSSAGGSNNDALRRLLEGNLRTYYKNKFYNRFLETLREYLKAVSGKVPTDAELELHLTQSSSETGGRSMREKIMDIVSTSPEEFNRFTEQVLLGDVFRGRRPSEDKTGREAEGRATERGRMGKIGR